MAMDTQVTVVMVPFVAQGHLGQLLHLSRVVSSYNIPVHYVSTTIHIRQASTRHQGWDLLAHHNIHVHEFPIPAFQCPAPDPNAKTKYPAQLVPSFEASIHLREPVFKLLTSLSASRRIVVIYDYPMASVVQDFVSLPNAESYIFQSTSAFFHFSYYWDLAGRPSPAGEEMLQQLPSTEDCFSPGALAFWNKQQVHAKNSSGELYNTSRAIEVGLENSGNKFIWVLRDADKGDIFTGDVRRPELPMGYEDRIKEAGQGMIVRGWAPQLEILAHACTGGFMSHCGWNSCLESMSMGVPIAAWPMHSDQPRNAMLITKVLSLGIVVKNLTPANDLVEALHIENAVKKLIASEEGDEMRKRAAELRSNIKKSIAEGGVSRLELDSFIDHITRSN